MYTIFQVKVMTSIRKPKRVTIRGNDEKEYHYLVKGGEDLRQDQRIEQLFFLMNQVLEGDPACKQRNLKLKTYQVIPMTPRFVPWFNLHLQYLILIPYFSNRLLAPQTSYFICMCISYIAMYIPLSILILCRALVYF